MLCKYFRPLSWIESQKMGAFLSVAQGSQEVPWLLELRLNMAEGEPGDCEGEGGKRPIALVGKGKRPTFHFERYWLATVLVSYCTD